MDEKLKNPDVLQVKRKNSKKAETVNRNAANQPDFVKYDKHSNALGNFASNFAQQFKNPTNFPFFKSPADKEAKKNPETLKNQPNLAAPVAEYKINPNLVDWNEFAKFGITHEILQNTGVTKDGTNLDRLLNYQKTDLVPILFATDGYPPQHTSARFILKPNADGTFLPSPHLLLEKPPLEYPHFGIEFTAEDKRNLLTTGNLGRIAEAEFRKDEKTPVYVSIDPQTNEIVTCHVSKVKIPDTYKGAPLDEEQKQKLSNGEKVKIMGMTSVAGKTFDGEIQFNADKRFFALTVNGRQDKRQNNVYQTFRNRELTVEQHNSLREGKTVYVNGLVDKNGRGYTGYITWNKEQGNFDFMFPKDYREAVVNGKVIPDDRYKTPVAVNSEGKTGEATKNLKEPLKSGQTQPDKKQEQEKPKKSRGVKM